jgi:D-glycero-alpha-D-manno-heptose 1-phosphate guanylyltransferase
MITTAIILAGGFGTRLQDIIKDVPKPMAPVSENPFLVYQLRYLKHYGIKNIVFSTGHLAEKIKEYFGHNFYGLNISYSHEIKPLGTGGGIRLAMTKCDEKNILVLNGDSFFDINLNLFYNQHCSFHSDCSLALREVSNSSRYGTIKLGDRGKIKSFREKSGNEESGLINGGVYIINRELFMNNTEAGAPFSIEKDYFEKKINELNIFGFTQEGYFIDIGIPEDYSKAQYDFKKFKY